VKIGIKTLVSKLWRLREVGFFLPKSVAVAGKKKIFYNNTEFTSGRCHVGVGHALVLSRLMGRLGLYGFGPNILAYINWAC
ncbi:hypothetical protein A2U01_0000335, partial [Trifolium medium]|nr:hypothetical protein [Trifolium medium]